MIEQEYTQEDVQILALRRRSILRKMQLISETPAVKLEERVKTSKASHKPPPGASVEGRSQDTPPDIDESMYAHFVWHFVRAQKDVDRTRRLLAAAEAAYFRFKFGSVPRETSEQRSARILRDYVGWRQIDVAVTEGVTVRHVERLRNEADRDPKTGLRWSDAPRPVPALGGSLYAGELAMT